MISREGTSPDIAVVVLDTLRKDAFDRHFDWLSGARYNNAWSTSHWTVPAHASLFTGYYGSELGVHGASKRLDCSEQPVAELLSDQGYECRGYSCNDHISKYFSFDRGFADFRTNALESDSGFNWAEWIFDHRDEGSSRYLQLIRDINASDASTLNALTEGVKIKLRDLGLYGEQDADSGAQNVYEYVSSLETIADSPEFLFLNLMEAHAPYSPPEEYRNTDPVTVDGPVATISDGPDVSSDDIETAYDDCVRYLSDIYADIFDVLCSRYDVIITLSDHGEAFGEHGAWEHFNGLYPEVTHVPMVVSLGDESPVELPQETNLPVSLFDVFQTMLDLADVPSPRGTRGCSLYSNRASDTQQYIETHGMLPQQRKRLEALGFEPQIIETYDCNLLGVCEGTGYSYETYDGDLRDWEVGVPNALEKIQSFDQERNWKAVDSDQEVPKHVQNRLKDLGYA